MQQVSLFIVQAAQSQLGRGLHCTLRQCQHVSGDVSDPIQQMGAAHRGVIPAQKFFILIEVCCNYAGLDR